MNNFKAKGNLDVEIERANTLFTQTRVSKKQEPRRTAFFDRAAESVSSDSSIDKLVNNGVE